MAVFIIGHLAIEVPDGVPVRIGLSPKVAQRRLGHSSITTTLRHYTDLEDDDQAADVLRMMPPKKVRAASPDSFGVCGDRMKNLEPWSGFSLDSGGGATDDSSMIECRTAIQGGPRGRMSYTGSSPVSPIPDRRTSSENPAHICGAGDDSWAVAPASRTDRTDGSGESHPTKQQPDSGMVPGEMPGLAALSPHETLEQAIATSSCGGVGGFTPTGDAEWKTFTKSRATHEWQTTTTTPNRSETLYSTSSPETERVPQPLQSSIGWTKSSPSTTTTGTRLEKPRDPKASMSRPSSVSTQWTSSVNPESCSPLLPSASSSFCGGGAFCVMDDALCGSGVPRAPEPLSSSLRDGPSSSSGGCVAVGGLSRQQLAALLTLPDDVRQAVAAALGGSK